MASPGLSLVAFQIICWFAFFGKEGEVASAETGMEAGTYFLVMVTVLASLALAGNGTRKFIVFLVLLSILLCYLSRPFSSMKCRSLSNHFSQCIVLYSW